MLPLEVNFSHDFRYPVAHRGESMKRFVFVFVLLSFGCESAEVKTGSDLVPQSEDTSTPSSDDGGPSTPDGGSDGESDDGGTTDGNTTDGAP